MNDTEIEFEGREFTDSDLRAISNLDRVQMLSLLDTAVTDNGFSELARARALVEVCIISDTLTDDALQVLAELPALRSLQIHRGPAIGDAGVHFLSRCETLRELYLKETAVTDKGLNSISKLPQVWSLILDDTNISDEGCAVLAGMPNLTILSLNRTHVEGHGLAPLHDNKLNIYLDGGAATDRGVIALAERLSNLKRISLNRTDVGDEGARALATLPRLNVVRLSHTKLTDEGLLCFAGHPHLDAIHIEGCAITSHAIQSLKEKRKLTVYGP